MSFLRLNISDFIKQDSDYQELKKKLVYDFCHFYHGKSKKYISRTKTMADENRDVLEKTHRHHFAKICKDKNKI
jgi:uncharacterized protein YeeX (DUF496 family)